jgi:LacI family transcriptional regulator
VNSITIKDIARICGVGVSTVSRAINNHPDINKETKDYILSVIEEYNYIPNNSARNLKRIETNAIAVLVKGITNPFFTDMIKIMEQEIEKRKYSLVLHHVEFNENEIDVALELIKEKRLRGIVFLGGHFSHSEDKLKKIPVPFVLSTIGGMVDENNRSGYSSVSVNDIYESKKVVDFLLDQGHKKIAIICADAEDESISSLRLEGYYQALRNHNIEPDKSWVFRMHREFEEYSIENGYNVALEILKSDEEFTALYAISDMLAMGACKALIDHGKKVPDDYSIVGFDGIKLGKYYNPSITTLVQPVEKIASETIRLLFEVFENNKKHKHLTFEGTLAIRESTKVL